MNKRFNFENLIVYQRSVSLSQKIFKLSKDWPREYLFGMTDQLRRASLSIPLNIAEGSSRTNKDFRHFLIIARGSCFECIPILRLAVELRLMNSTQEHILYEELYEISLMISGLRKTLISKI